MFLEFCTTNNKKLWIKILKKCDASRPTLRLEMILRPSWLVPQMSRSDWTVQKNIINSFRHLYLIQDISGIFVHGISTNNLRLSPTLKGKQTAFSNEGENGTDIKGTCPIQRMSPSIHPWN